MFFSTKTIIVEFGCNKADQLKMLAEPPADIVFDHTYMSFLSKVPTQQVLSSDSIKSNRYLLWKNCMKGQRKDHNISYGKSQEQPAVNEVPEPSLLRLVIVVFDGFSQL